MRVFILLLLTLSAVTETEAIFSIVTDFLGGLFDAAIKIFGKVFDWGLTAFNKFVDTGFRIGGKALGVVVDPFGWWKTSANDHGHKDGTVAICPARSDILFVFDTSGSTNNREFDLAKSFAYRLSEHFQIGEAEVRFAAITFGSRVQEAFNFKTYSNRDGLKTGISRLPFVGGSTKTYLALDYIRQQNLFSTSNGAREGSSKIVIVATDGSSDSLLQTNAAANALKGQYHVVAVGIGSGLGVELYNIASGYQNVFTADNFDSLIKIEQDVARRLCEIPEADGNIPPTGSGSGTCAKGFEKNPNKKASCIDIDECKRGHSCQQNCVNTIGSYRCTCRAGSVINPDDSSKCLSIRTCSAQVDIVFAVDASGSLGSENFKTQQTFVAKLTHHFGVGPKGAQFGGLLFATRVEKLFDLNQYSSRTDITSSLLQAPYIEGGTNTHLALKYISDNQMFSPSNGGRSVTKVVVLVTDGTASNQPSSIAAANDLKSQGVKVIAVGIGSQVELEKLIELASDAKNVYAAVKFDLLDYLEQSVADDICRS